MLISLTLLRLVRGVISPHLLPDFRGVSERIYIYSLTPDFRGVNLNPNPNHNLKYNFIPVEIPIPISIQSSHNPNHVCLN
jgi:hypothetical protein